MSVQICLVWWLCHGKQIWATKSDMVRVSSSGISSSNSSSSSSSSTDIWNVFCFFPLERTRDDSFSVSLWFTHIHTFSMHFDHKSVRGQILYSQCCCSSKHPTLWTPAFYQDPCPCTTCFFFFSFSTWFVCSLIVAADYSFHFQSNWQMINRVNISPVNWY